MVNDTDSDDTEALPHPPEHHRGASIDSVPSHVREFKDCSHGVPVLIGSEILSVREDNCRELVVPAESGSNLY